MQERTASAENSSVEVQSKPSTEGNTCMTSSKEIEFLYLPKGLESICHITGTVIHLSKNSTGIQFNEFAQVDILLTINKWHFRTIKFLYLSKGLESGCQMTRIVICLKNTRNFVHIFSDTWWTVI